MRIEELRAFLIDSNKAGYAGGDEKKWIKEKDGSTTIPYKKGLWKSHDNFFGGEPYGGRTIISFDNKPVWMMVYYGWVVEGEDIGKIYEMLRNALMQMPEDHPYRGPKEYGLGQLVYKNSWQGELDNFSGEEQIMSKDKLVYKANYIGGLIDQKSGV